MSNMSLSAFVYGCAPDVVHVSPPEPTVSDFLPPVIDHLIDNAIVAVEAENAHMQYDYTRRNIDAIVGGDF